MKNQQNISISVLSIVILLTSQISFSAITEPVFELYNKTSFTVHIILTNANTNKKLADVGIKPNEAWKFTEGITKNDILRLEIVNETDRRLSYVVDLNAPGKTKYISYNAGKNIPVYPQTGPLGGLMGKYNPLMGKTESGLSLTNNIKQSEIIVQEAHHFSKDFYQR